MKTKSEIPNHPVWNEILNGACRTPHDFLGMHVIDGKVAVRVYDPAATMVSVIVGKDRFPMIKADENGLFVCVFGRKKEAFAYKIERCYADSKFTSADPYCFLPTLGDMDIYQGEHHRVFDVMGAHVRNLGGVEGVSFAVWAPNAKRVSVVGDFNCWDGRRHPMRMLGLSGIWELFIPGLKSGDVYNAYRSYCMQVGDYIRSTTDFYYALEAAGFVRRKTSAGIMVSGLQLKSDFME